MFYYLDGNQLFALRIMSTVVLSYASSVNAGNVDWWRPSLNKLAYLATLNCTWYICSEINVKHIVMYLQLLTLR